MSSCSKEWFHEYRSLNSVCHVYVRTKTTFYLLLYIVGFSWIKTNFMFVLSSNALPVLNTGVALESVTENTVTLSWTPIAGSSFYQVLYRPSGSIQQEQSMIVSNGPQNNRTTLTGLLPGTMYDIRVVSFPPGGQLEVGSITPTTGQYIIYLQSRLFTLWFFFENLKACLWFLP